MLLFALGSRGRRKGGIEESAVCAPNLACGEDHGVSQGR